MFSRGKKAPQLSAKVVFRSKVATRPETGTYLVLEKERLLLYGNKAKWKSKELDELVAEFFTFELFAKPDPDAGNWFEVHTPVLYMRFKVKNQERRDNWVEAINVISKMPQNQEVRPIKWAQMNKQTVHVHVIEGHHMCYESISQPSEDTWVEISIDFNKERFKHDVNLPDASSNVPNEADILKKDTFSENEELDVYDSGDFADSQPIQSEMCSSTRLSTNITDDEKSKSFPFSQISESSLQFSEKKKEPAQSPSKEKELSLRKSKDRGNNALKPARYDEDDDDAIPAGAANDYVESSQDGEGMTLDYKDFVLTKRKPYVKKKTSVFIPIVQKSKTIYHNRHPVWNISKSFAAVFPDETVLVQVFDKKRGYIGETRVPIIQIVNLGTSGEKDSRQLENWFALFDVDSNIRIPGRVHIRLMTKPATECDNLRDPGNVKLFRSIGPSDFNEQIKVFCGTWNVGNEGPMNNLETWIIRDPEIVVYAVGFQEAEFPPRKPHATCASDLLSCLKNCIGDQYECVHFISLWAIRLVIFVRVDWLYDVTNLTSTVVRTGIGGVMGNKGGNIVSFGLRHTKFCFVNCHLAAHQSKVKARNEDIRAIVQQSIGFTTNICKGKLDILSCSHYTFWMGDMNYRLNHGPIEETGNSPTEEAFKDLENKIAQKELSILYDEDQLVNEMKNGAVLHGFQELPPDFVPTFKVERLKHLSYNPKRSPAWCDRILWKDSPGLKISVLRYESANDIMSSDHKPVGGLFQCSVFFSDSSRNLAGKMEDAMFTSLYVTNIKLDRPNESRKLVAIISSDFFEEPVLQSVDWNDERKVAEFHRIKLLHENFKRLKNTLISIELREGDSSIGFGSTIMTGLDYNYNVPEREDFKAPDTMARIRGASLASFTASSANPSSTTRGSSVLSSNQANKFISPNRVRSMRNSTKGAQFPVISDIKPKLSTYNSGDALSDISEGVENQAAGDKDKKMSHSLPASPSLIPIIESSNPTSPSRRSELFNATNLTPSTPPILQSSISAPVGSTLIEDLSTQLQTLTFLDTEFVVDITSNSTYICTLKGTLRLRFRLGV